MWGGGGGGGGHCVPCHMTDKLAQSHLGHIEWRGWGGGLSRSNIDLPVTDTDQFEQHVETLPPPYRPTQGR